MLDILMQHMVELLNITIKWTVKVQAVIAYASHTKASSYQLYQVSANICWYVFDNEFQYTYCDDFVNNRLGENWGPNIPHMLKFAEIWMISCFDRHSVDTIPTEKGSMRRHIPSPPGLPWVSLLFQIRTFWRFWRKYHTQKKIMRIKTGRSNNGRWHDILQVPKPIRSCSRVLWKGEHACHSFMLSTLEYINFGTEELSNMQALRTIQHIMLKGSITISKPWFKSSIAVRWYFVLKYNMHGSYYHKSELIPRWKIGCKRKSRIAVSHSTKDSTNVSINPRFAHRALHLSSNSFGWHFRSW